MKLLSTSPSLIMALVLLSNAVWMASGQFTKVGDGVCLDSESRYYPGIRGDGFTQDDPQKCYDWCTQANEEKLVGFMVREFYTAKRCLCLLDSTDLEGVEESDYTNPSPYDYFSNTGTGRVTGLVSSQTDYHCYRNDVSLL